MRYSAWLAFDGETSHGCALHDISDTGARIDVEDADKVPNSFVLLLSGNGSARRNCRVVWRKPQQIGVTFGARLLDADKAKLVPAEDAGASSKPADSDASDAI